MMSQTSPFDHLPSFTPAQSGFTIICCLAVTELPPYKGEVFFIDENPWLQDHRNCGQIISTKGY
jgi:hypothetical protein